MNRSIWETLVTALQAWEKADFNATNEHDRRLEFKAFDAAIDWLLSVEPKEDN